MQGRWTILFLINYNIHIHSRITKVVELLQQKVVELILQWRGLLPNSTSSMKQGRKKITFVFERETWYPKQTVWFKTAHLTLQFIIPLWFRRKWTKGKRRKKLTALDMTANSSTRLCLEFCREKSEKVPFRCSRSYALSVRHLNNKTLIVPNKPKSLYCFL